MKQYTLSLIFVVTASMSIAQVNNAILDLQSTSQTAFQMPTMTEAERLAMDMTNFSDEEGILVFDKTNSYFYYYNSYISDWAQMGDSNAESPIGPQGPIGNSAVGQQGPQGPGGYHCWDLNENGISDPWENIVPYNESNTGTFNGYDCRGLNGDIGLFGEQGDDGPPGIAGDFGAQGPSPGVSYTMVEFTTETTTVQTVYSSLFNTTSSTERIFVQPIGTAPLVDVAQFGTNKWWLKTRDNSTMPVGASYKIIRIP